MALLDWDEPAIADKQVAGGNLDLFRILTEYIEDASHAVSFVGLALTGTATR